MSECRRGCALPWPQGGEQSEQSEQRGALEAVNHSGSESVSESLFINNISFTAQAEVELEHGLALPVASLPLQITN